MKLNTLYIVKDAFFELIKDENLKMNKEENRPHYYCFQDERTKLYWLIPLSKKVDKARETIEKRLKENKKCDILHIGKLYDNTESVFLIADMFPILEEYIERPYLFGNTEYEIKDKKLIREVNKKAKNILYMIHKGVKFTPRQIDVLKIERYLLENKL